MACFHFLTSLHFIDERPRIHKILRFFFNIVAYISFIRYTRIFEDKKILCILFTFSREFCCSPKHPFRILIYFVIQFDNFSLTRDSRIFGSCRPRQFVAFACDFVAATLKTALNENIFHFIVNLHFRLSSLAFFLCFAYFVILFSSSIFFSFLFSFVV